MQFVDCVPNRLLHECIYMAEPPAIVEERSVSCIVVGLCSIKSFQSGSHSDSLCPVAVQQVALQVVPPASQPAVASLRDRQLYPPSLLRECVCVCVKGVGAGGVCLVRHHSNGVHGNLTPEKCSTAPKIGPEHNHMPPPSSDSLHCFQRSRGVWHNCRESAGEKTTW